MKMATIRIITPENAGIRMTRRFSGNLMRIAPISSTWLPRWTVTVSGLSVSRFVGLAIWHCISCVLCVSTHDKWYIPRLTSSSWLCAVWTGHTATAHDMIVAFILLINIIMHFCREVDHQMPTRSKFTDTPSSSLWTYCGGDVKNITQTRLLVRTRCDPDGDLVTCEHKPLPLVKEFKEVISIP